MGKLMIRNAGDSAWITIAGVGTVVQQDAEPSNPHAGMMWLDTDAPSGLQSEIRDTDGDTKIQCEESADEDIIRFDAGGNETARITSSALNVYGVEGADGIIQVVADEGDDNADWWKLWAETADDTFNLASYSTGSYVKVITVTSDGAVTKPVNVFFHANLETANTNIEGTEKITFDRVVFETGGSNYNAAGSAFTSPVDGTYLLTVTVRLNQWDLNCTYLRIQFVTTNTTFYKYYSPVHESAEDVYGMMHFTIVCQLDEDDTAYVQVTQSGGDWQLDTVAGNNYSYFMGYLLG